MYMHAHGSGQSQRVLSLLYNLYCAFYLVLGYEQLRPTVSRKGRRCTPQRPCEVPEIQYFDWWGETVRNFRDLQATPVSTRRCESETTWQLEAACTGLQQHYSQVPTSKFEVSIAQPLPKLAMATQGHKGVTGYTWDIKPYFPPTEFKYYHKK